LKLDRIQPLLPAQTWWLLAAGLSAFLPLSRHVPVWLALATAATFAWCAALAWWKRPLPSRWFLFCLSIAGIAAILLQYHTLFGQQAGVALLLLFLALKQLESRTPRDALVVVLLVYFLTLAQFFEDQSILVGLMTLCTTLVATAALASLTDRQAHPLALLRLSATLLAQALPFMLILFLLFPRISGPLWGLSHDAHSRLTGLSETMSPGSINKLIQSEAIAFRAQFHGPVPERRDLYWRGPVLTRLEGRTWHPEAHTATPLETPNLPYAPLPGSPEYRYSVTLEAHDRPWLFALELPGNVPEDAFLTHDFQIHARSPVRERRRDDFVSHPRVTQAPEHAETLAAALQLPPGINPRTQALGRTWRAEKQGDDRRIVAHALDFMREQRFVYTLQPPMMSQNVADDFLFSARRGFCEHFSASFVVLMRAAGVPSRVVTGYQGGEHNPVDDTWVIRQSDAHAWAEVWIAGSGWQRVDPTAASHPARIEQNLAAALPVGEPLPLLAREGFGWLREMRFRWWAVTNAWNQWVLGYDPQRQRELLEKLGMHAPNWQTMIATLALLLGAALLLLAAALLWQRPHPDRVQRLWLTFCRRLARRGLLRHPWEGPRDYALRAAAAFPSLAADIDSIATLYARLRYSTPDTDQTRELSRRIALFKP